VASSLRAPTASCLRAFVPHRAAFSLAELMIALVVLGLGLLFIAAALPAGIEYARRNADLAAAEAAGLEALNTLELYVRTSRVIVFNSSNPSAWRRADSIVRPRLQHPSKTDVYLLATDPNVPDPPGPIDYEPIIKVRPFVMRNVGASANRRAWHVVDDTEAAVAAYLQSVLNIAPNPLETDVPPFLRDLPVCPATVRFYPPVQSVTRFRVEDFFGDRAAYRTFDPRTDSSLQVPAGQPDFDPVHDGVDVARQELEQCLGRRIAWAAFYRRVSYPKWTAGTDGLFASDDSDQSEAPIDGTGDPLLYEFIMVVTLRPTEQHRYPMQDLTGGISAFVRPRALAENAGTDISGSDRLAPTPWLVVFQNLHEYRGVGTGGDDVVRGNQQTGERVVNPGAPQAAQREVRLRFNCRPELGALLPVGSKLIPARNDYRSTALVGNGIPAGRQGRVGFVPSSPDTLPIFTVIERPDLRTIVVESDGFFPWQARGTHNNPDVEFPFWIIPPPFVERGSDGQPVYDDRSPIVQVLRRTVRLTEVE